MPATDNRGLGGRLGERTLPQNVILSNPPGAASFDEVLGAFEHSLYESGRSEPTVATYGSALRVFARFYIESLNKPGPFVSRLQETDLRAFIDHLRRDRLLKPTSLNRYVAALRAFSSFVLAKRWHRRDIAAALQTYRLELPAELPRLSKQEARRLVTSVDLAGRNGPRDRAVVQMFLHCGLRVGELTRLRRDDVTLTQKGGRVRVRNDKAHSERHIPLNKTARDALAYYFDRRGKVGGSEPLFLSERRKALCVSSVQHLIKRYLADVGRDDLSVHALRHHFALRFYERCGKLTDTQKVLGHRNINTTARYAQTSEAEIAKTLEALAD